MQHHSHLRNGFHICLKINGPLPEQQEMSLLWDSSLHVHVSHVCAKLEIGWLYFLPHLNTGFIVSGTKPTVQSHFCLYILSDQRKSWAEYTGRSSPLIHPAQSEAARSEETNLIAHPAMFSFASQQIDPISFNLHLRVESK